MAIKPISCGISNINLQTVGKTGQPERGLGREVLQCRQSGRHCLHSSVRLRGKGHLPAFQGPAPPQPGETEAGEARVPAM